MIFLVDTAIIALLLACEFHPNKYADNILVLGTAWGVLQMSIIWTLMLAFASKLPSAGMINNALSMTVSRGKWRSLLGRLARVQNFVIAILSVTFGHWFLAFAYGMFMIGVRFARHSAKVYLTDVQVDKLRKSAVMTVQ